MIDRRSIKHPFGLRRHDDLFYHHEMTSLYYATDHREASLLPLHYVSECMKIQTENPFNFLNYTKMGRNFSAQVDIAERMTRRYKKPNFGILTSQSSSGRMYMIEEKVVLRKDFCRLLHFKKHRVQGSTVKYKQSETFPKVLIIAPYSGHYATLLRDTARSMLKDHDVYIADWENARDVPLYKGRFTLDDYVQYVIDFIHELGCNIHILAVCQPSVPVMAAVSILAAHNDPCQPCSMTLMGGPIDTRVNQTKVNIWSERKDLSWFNHKIIANVPHYYVGAGRRVCPGFMLLAGFMSLNIEKHLTAPRTLFKHLTKGDDDSAIAHRRFYDEYRSVLDLPADYFLDSVFTVFQEHALPRGIMMCNDELVDPSAIEKTALMTVEGERDDISGPGQTYAAHELCTNLPLSMQKHHLQKHVGHYGVFNGRRWREQIVPEITTFIARNDPGNSCRVQCPALGKKSPKAVKNTPKTKMVNRDKNNVKTIA